MNIQNKILNILKHKITGYTIAFDIRLECIEFNDEDTFCIMLGSSKFFYGSVVSTAIEFDQKFFQQLLAYQPELFQNYLSFLASQKLELEELNNPYLRLDTVFGVWEYEKVIENCVFILRFEENENFNPFRSTKYVCEGILSKYDFLKIINLELPNLIEKYYLKMF